MQLHKLFIILLITAAFYSCNTTKSLDFSSINSSYSIVEDNGYFSGIFLDDCIGVSDYSKYTMVIAPTNGGKEYNFNFSKEYKATLYALPPGNYYIKKIYKIGHVTTGTGVYTSSREVEFCLDLPEEIIFDFKIIPGKITYIGDLVIKQNVAEFLLRLFVDGKNRLKFTKNKEDISTYLSLSYQNLDTDNIIDF